MIDWTDEQQMVRGAVKRFIDEEVRPHVEELEHGDLPPYDILRKMFATFGMDAMAGDRFDRQIARRRVVGDGLDDGEGQIQLGHQGVDAAQHAVAPDVGVNDGFGTVVLELLGVEGEVGAQQVVLEAFRGLVGELDALL